MRWLLVIINRPPEWFRVLQIIDGAISLILSAILIVLGFPIVDPVIIITLLSIALLAIGIERVATGIMLLRSVYSAYLSPTTTTTKLSGRSEITHANIGLGAVGIIFAIIAFVFPQLVSDI
jgi:uncharacterized membrane protein